MTEQLKYILGIETSCDETAAAVVDNKYNIITNVVFSQQKLHAPYFGVVPELASRTHYEKIHYIVDKALKKINMRKINLIAYTEKPGLKGALLIGKTVAQTLAYIYSKPVVGVDHLWGHIYSVIISHKGNIKFPFVSLIISGGHTELSIVYSSTERQVLGETRDDAVGEAFDKIAKMLYNYLATPEKHFLRHQLFRNKYIKLLSYPGGPIIEKLAKFGNPVSINFPKPYMLDSWDFSFSGLKTSVLYFLQNKKLKFTEQLLFDICASFQKTIVDTLVTKTLFAVEKTQCRNICISGGVSANKYLRKQFTQIAKQNNLQIYFPKLKLSTDNAAMIASAGLKFFISSYRNTN